MASAIKTILLADLVMSLDNVIGVAAAAKGNTLLLIIGLAISIPLVMFASRLLLVLMDRFPIIITLGAALLGWVAGDMAVTDPVISSWVDPQRAPSSHWAAPAGQGDRGGGVRQVACRPRRRQARRREPPVEAGAGVGDGRVPPPAARRRRIAGRPSTRRGA